MAWHGQPVLVDELLFITRHEVAEPAAITIHRGGAMERRAVTPATAAVPGSA
jgi:hypothetical protein